MRSATIATFVLVGFVLFAVAPAQAKSSTTPFTAAGVFAPTGDPVRFWIDEDGVQHIRGQPNAGTLSGGLVGSLTFELNANIDPATGGGDLHGPFAMTTNMGSFEGSFSGMITGGLASVEFVGQSRDGAKIMGTTTEIAPMVPAVFEGTILSPHG